MSEITVHYTGPVVTREDAKSLGYKRYFTGAPCKNGHIDERKINNDKCYRCDLFRDRKWKSKNKEKLILYSREYRKKFPLVGREQIKKYREEHPNWQKESDKKRYARDRESLLLKTKKHQQENKEMWAAYSRNRRARKLFNGGEHTGEQIKYLGELQKWKCGYCKKSIKKKYHADHIIAIYNGGSNDIKNIQLLCPKCNSFKRAKDPIEFAQEIGLLL